MILQERLCSRPTLLSGLLGLSDMCAIDSEKFRYSVRMIAECSQSAVEKLCQNSSLNLTSLLSGRNTHFVYFHFLCYQGGLCSREQRGSCICIVLILRVDTSSAKRRDVALKNKEAPALALCLFFEWTLAWP